MNRTDLTYRLRQVGLKKPQFAEMLGMSPETVYQWDEVPQYAVALVELLEEIARLKGHRVAVVPTERVERPKRPGRPENFKGYLKGVKK